MDRTALPPLSLCVATRSEQIAAALVLRGMVFVEEQGIAYGEEFDVHDGEALHILGVVEGEPVAVARLRFATGWAKLERIAVRRVFRGRGYGRALVDFMVDEAKRCGYPHCRMHAQAHLQGFYAEHGFRPAGPIFSEAGIDHVCMLRERQSAPSDGTPAPEWRIESLTLEDYAAVRSLWQSSPGIGLSAADSREAIARYLARNPGMSRVARSSDNRLVGAVLCGHDERRGYLHHLAVRPAWRGRGIGGALVQSALACLHRAGIDKSHVFVLSDNADGRRFWQQIGWQLRSDLQVVSRQISDTEFDRNESAQR